MNTGLDAAVEAACTELGVWLPPLAYDARRAYADGRLVQARDDLLLAEQILTTLGASGYTCGWPSEMGADSPKVPACAVSRAIDVLFDYILDEVKS